MKIKAVFMDLDGTLLRNNHTISEKIKNKLKELEEKEVKIFISTGSSILIILLFSSFNLFNKE